ncbi:MAG TPA: hypothetical protein VKY86_04955 [Promicromonospora sp.]|nr:hypothetical protein [Promicromonospora sp.]
MKEPRACRAVAGGSGPGSVAAVDVRVTHSGRQGARPSSSRPWPGRQRRELLVAPDALPERVDDVEPAPGVLVDRGTVVTLHVSTGP